MHLVISLLTNTGDKIPISKFRQISKQHFQSKKLKEKKVILEINVPVADFISLIARAAVMREVAAIKFFGLLPPKTFSAPLALAQQALKEQKSCNQPPLVAANGC